MQDDSNLYFLLEYLPYGELQKQIRGKSMPKGGLSESAIKFYLAEIVLAIEDLHKNNIIYRDLKPENILIDADGHIRLIDFGFAKMLKDIKKDRAKTNCGTPGYAAPEVMMGIEYNYKVDIWSIGILICELVGGFTPFQANEDADSPLKIIESINTGRLKLPKNLSNAERDMIKNILVVDPS